MTSCNFRLGVAALATSAAIPLAGQPAQAAEWTPTWMASPQPAWDAGNPLPMNLPRISNQTIRQVARISVGGDRLRIVVSNEYGREPLVIGAAHVGRTAPEGRIEPSSDRAVTFSGRGRVTIPPGARVVSDPVDLRMPALSEVSVSLFLPQTLQPATFHWDGKQTSYIAAGDVTGSVALRPTATTLSRLFLSGVLVARAEPTQLVVALGDSITDGASATPDANSRWPDYLAERLAPHNVAVVNAGISGARIMKDRMGTNALARFDRDVVAQPNVKAVVVLLGINDISWPGSTFEPREPLRPVDEAIAGLRQLIARAHLHPFGRGRLGG